jgi:hypothetical protein
MFWAFFFLHLNDLDSNYQFDLQHFFKQIWTSNLQMKKCKLIFNIYITSLSNS